MIILFHHIQKTGGNTFLKAFTERYGEDASWRIHPGQNGENLTMDQVRDLDKLGTPICISSHMVDKLYEIALHEIADQIDIAGWYTILREPYDRCCSHFAHLCRNINNTLYEDIVAVEGNIADFLALHPDTELTNLQTKQLGRCVGLRHAIDLLDISYTYGFTHDMSEAIRKANDRFGLDMNTDTGKQVYNFGGDRPLYENLPTEAQQAIAQANTMDVALYQWARGDSR